MHGVDSFIKCPTRIISSERTKNDKPSLTSTHSNNLISENKIGRSLTRLFITGCVFRIFDTVDVPDSREIYVSS